MLTIHLVDQGCGRRFVARFRVTTWWEAGGEAGRDTVTSFHRPESGKCAAAQVGGDHASSGKSTEGGRRSGESRWWPGRVAESSSEIFTSSLSESASIKAGSTGRVGAGAADQASNGPHGKAKGGASEKKPLQLTASNCVEPKVAGTAKAKAAYESGGDACSTSALRPKFWQQVKAKHAECCLGPCLDVSCFIS